MAPREVYKAAILPNASGLIIVHNHPSGVPAPSPEDTSLTQLLQEGGELLGIPVLDYIIIGEQNYFSFAEEGLLRIRKADSVTQRKALFVCLTQTHGRSIFFNNFHLPLLCLVQVSTICARIG